MELLPVSDIWKAYWEWWQKWRNETLQNFGLKCEDEDSREQKYAMNDSQVGK